MLVGADPVSARRSGEYGGYSLPWMTSEVGEHSDSPLRPPSRRYDSWHRLDRIVLADGLVLMDAITQRVIG